jgi:hypothetical protein
VERATDERSAEAGEVNCPWADDDPCDGWPQEREPGDQEREWVLRLSAGPPNRAGTVVHAWRDGAATFVFRFVNFAADVMRLR